MLILRHRQENTKAPKGASDILRDSLEILNSKPRGINDPIIFIVGRAETEPGKEAPSDEKAKKAQSTQQKSTATTPLPPDPTTRSLYAKGAEAFAAKQFSLARTHFIHACELNRQLHGHRHPSMGVHLYNTALTWEFLGNQEIALELYLESIAIKPTANAILRAHLLLTKKKHSASGAVGLKSTDIQSWLKRMTAAVCAPVPPQ